MLHHLPKRSISLLQPVKGISPSIEMNSVRWEGKKKESEAWWIASYTGLAPEFRNEVHISIQTFLIRRGLI